MPRSAQNRCQTAAANHSPLRNVPFPPETEPEEEDITCVAASDGTVFVLFRYEQKQAGDGLSPDVGTVRLTSVAASGETMWDEEVASSERVVVSRWSSDHFATVDVESGAISIRDLSSFDAVPGDPVRIPESDESTLNSVHGPVTVLPDAVLLRDEGSPSLRILTWESGPLQIRTHRLPMSTGDLDIGNGVVNTPGPGSYTADAQDGEAAVPSPQWIWETSGIKAIAGDERRELPDLVTYGIDVAPESTTWTDASAAAVTYMSPLTGDTFSVSEGGRVTVVGLEDDAVRWSSPPDVSAKIATVAPRLIIVTNTNGLKRIAVNTQTGEEVAMPPEATQVPLVSEQGALLTDAQRQQWWWWNGAEFTSLTG